MFGLFEDKDAQVMEKVVQGNSQILAQLQNVTTSLQSLQTEGEQDSPLADDEWLAALRKEGRGV